VRLAGTIASLQAVLKVIAPVRGWAKGRD
jgi:hypothetical protein